ncbi:MAG: aminotransferase class I/II-fold pyridoxal phosphate-dependent enzyme [Janthinobacterium lividum]
MTAGPASINQFRQHGGRIDVARRIFTDAPADWIDLSTGIAPRAYRHATVTGDARRLPSPDELADLERAAAAAFGVDDPERVVAMPGSELGLRMVAVALAPKRVAVVRPGYGGHLTAWGGAEVIPVTDVAASGCDVTILANPNNPDGRRIARAELAAAAEGSGWLVVDEAFADADPIDSLAPPALPNVIVLRSFGKFYGLPGLRLGFVIAPLDVAAKLRQLIGDWPVATPVLRIATAAYRDTAWQARQRRFLHRAAARLDRILLAAGFEIAGGTALFRLARHADADTRFLSLAAAGILVRPFDPGSGLLRFGLPDGRSQWRRLASALQETPS